MSQPRIFMIRQLRWFALLALLVGVTAALPGRDEDKPADKKGIRVEEEDDSYKPGKPVLRIEEPDVVDKTSRLFPRPVADLRLAVRAAKSSYLSKIYSELEVPHDLVVFKADERTERVQPLTHFVGDRAVKGALELIPFGADWKPGTAHTAPPNSIESVRHYEQLIQAAVAEVLANDKNLLPPERLAAAEQLLTVALTFHETARRGDEWQRVGNDLRRVLLEVLLSQVRETGEAKDWGEAADLAQRLMKGYPAEDAQVRIAAALTTVLLKALNEPPIKTTRLREVRQQVRRITDQYATNAVAQEVAASLRQQAGQLLDQAKKAVDEKQLPRAEELLQQVAELDPQSQDLRDLRTKLYEIDPESRLLRVGVRELPRFFSPARATTDAELRGVELLFEGLMKIVPGPDGAARFRPGLAEFRPRIVPQGRDFLLPRHATWSNDKPVSAADIRYTVDKLKEGQGGRERAWGDQIKEVVIGDPPHVTITLMRGHLEPLALMTFKIIPEGAKADDNSFAEKPITSGPYRLGAKGMDAIGAYRAFVSNPAYGNRPGRAGLPHIREIRFYESKDPVKDLKEDSLDLALDLTAPQAAALKKVSKILVPPPGPNRRIYYLAINHEPGTVLSNASFRRGLALAIHRDELLDEYFRKGLGKEVHKALNSPFPAGSWACKNGGSDKSLDPFDAKLAEIRLSEGLNASRGAKVQLSLKYPAGDPKLADAMNDLRKQVLAASKDRVALELTPLPAHELRKAVESHNFQLAYCHYDFPDETYWLGPLLGQDGNNDMKYRGAALQNLINEAIARREFDKVLERVRAMQGVLDNDMPLIPLWQLDPLSAYRENLKPTHYDRTMGLRKEVEKVPYDPLLVFTDAEHWRLDR